MIVTCGVCWKKKDGNDCVLDWKNLRWVCNECLKKLKKKPKK